ncbi:MAG: alpha-amylase family glycosyl hydrolase [Acutalibacteraceae bacterium]
MRRVKKYTALFLALMMLITSSVFATGVNAASVDTAETGADSITIHYYSEKANPYVYYWNSLPQNISVDYPGKAMTADSKQGANWYTYTFNNVTKINLLFTDANGNQETGKELTRQSAGEYWYKNNRWTSQHPDTIVGDTSGDMREDTIYFVITTRFYDGDTGNNVHCWDDGNAGNPDTDPAWRGDFAGLIERLDYIKALGFSAIWITPVVTNASGYDYHGYHAMDFSTVDARYESAGATYQDLIDAAHEKGMKIIQDIVINHSGNFGEATLAPMFEKVFSDVKELESIDTLKMIPDTKFAQNYGSTYYSLEPGDQYQARLAIMKQDQYDTDFNYHHFKDLSWESPTVQTGQIAGDCVDINTESKFVADYLNECYTNYIGMGVDGFRMDTEKHVNRLSLNEWYFPEWIKAGGEDFLIFGEVCTRVSEFWNHGIPSISAPFYTWAETESKYKNCFGSDWYANYELTQSHYHDYGNTSNAPTSDNAFLKGNDYHTPDYSKSNGTSVIDFPMHWNFSNASNAFRRCLEQDAYYNDATWNVTYVDSHDYGPDMDCRFNGGTQAWAENLNLLFTFRGIPCLYYGSELEFQGGVPMDVGPNAPLSTTGRAYFGDYLEGSVTATDFSEYTASGKVAETLNYPLAKHIQRLNQIRRAIPALQKGQYSTANISGNLMAFKRGYTDPDTKKKSFVCVTITDGATFSNIPNGTYIDAVTGDKKTVTNGSLDISAPGKGNIRAYVLCDNGYTGISGKIGEDGTYLK